MSREQGDTKLDLGSTKIYLWEHQENNSGSREKRVKFQREPGAWDPPLQRLRGYVAVCTIHTVNFPCNCRHVCIFSCDVCKTVCLFMSCDVEVFVHVHVLVTTSVRLFVSLVKPVSFVLTHVGNLTNCLTKTHLVN